jgi:hypothetical protein
VLLELSQGGVLRVLSMALGMDYHPNGLSEEKAKDIAS